MINGVCINTDSALYYSILQVFWAYIVGMLTSLGKMKLDRIHSTLKMFALQSTGGKECTQVRIPFRNKSAQYALGFAYKEHG